VRIQIKLLENESDFGADLGHVDFSVVDLHAVHDEFTLLDGFQAVDAANQRAFPRSARAADHHHLTLCDLKIDAVQNMKVPKPFVDVFERYHIFSSFFSSKAFGAARVL
jgi:hypothetical protein